MRIVKLTKLAGKPDATLPIGFAVEGPDYAEPTVGKAYRLTGYIRTSDGEKWEWFATTPLIEIDGDLLITQNSTWKREVL